MEMKVTTLSVSQRTARKEYQCDLYYLIYSYEPFCKGMLSFSELRVLANYTRDYTIHKGEIYVEVKSKQDGELHTQRYKKDMYDLFITHRIFDLL